MHRREVSADTRISKRTLHECAQFYRCFPIVRRGAQFNWAQYRVICQVKDATKRTALMRDATRHGWTTEQLISQVRTWNAAVVHGDSTDPGTARLQAELLTPQCGTPGLHRIVENSLGLSVDLGFRHYWPLSPEQKKRFAKGDIVRIANDDSLRHAEGATKAELFTYSARLVRVVDGDTLVVALEVSPGVFLEQKLRLRGLDCPEIDTPEGKAAKRLVEATLTPATRLTIHTTKPDKYDRYLADVFVGGASANSDPPSSISEPREALFLNNAVLENGHATRKDAWEFGDWEKDFSA